MKIIDLLNKIANGEEVPNEFKYDNLIFKKRWDNAYFDNDGDNLYNSLCIDFSNLNDEIKIIEEDEKIEKLELVSNGSENSYALLNEYGTKCALTKHSKIMCDKINEIIDYINNKD